MTDGVLTAEAWLALENLAKDWRKREACFGDFDTCADELEALLSRWRSAHGSREAEK
jgi:hypothetical protein